MAFLLEIVFGRLAHTFKQNFSCFSAESYEVMPVAVAQRWLQGRVFAKAVGWFPVTLITPGLSSNFFACLIFLLPPWHSQFPADTHHGQWQQVQQSVCPGTGHRDRE